jgi:hypothetical protein
MAQAQRIGVPGAVAPGVRTSDGWRISKSRGRLGTIRFYRRRPVQAVGL